MNNHAFVLWLAPDHASKWQAVGSFPTLDLAVQYAVAEFVGTGWRVRPAGTLPYEPLPLSG
jgi:hypothetical protein